MYTYWILLFGLLCIWYISFVTNGKEIMSPASVVCGMFTFSVLLCIYGFGKWNEIVLGVETIGIILLGCASFAFGCSLAYSSGRNKVPFYKSEFGKGKGFSVDVKIWKIVLLVLALLFIAYVRIESMKRIAAQNELTFDSIIALSKWYREKFSRLFGAGTVLASVGESFIEKQILRFATVISNVSVVTLLIGLSEKKKKLVYASIVLLMVFVIYNITNGGRAGVFFKVVTIVFGIYVLALRKTDTKTLNRLFILLGIVMILLGLPMFYYSAALVGRGSSRNIMEYLSFYIGCGIPSLEMRIQGGIANHLLGQNVFYGVHTLLYKVGLLNRLDGFANEWVILNGYRSNVYTAWYRFYADFGIIGVIIFPFLVGYFFTYVYKRCKESNNLLYWCILCSWGYVIFDLNRDEYLFGQLLGTAPIINLCLSIAVTYIVCRSTDKSIVYNVPETGRKNEHRKNKVLLWQESFKKVSFNKLSDLQEIKQQ